MVCCVDENFFRTLSVMEVIFSIFKIKIFIPGILLFAATSISAGGNVLNLITAMPYGKKINSPFLLLPRFPHLNKIQIESPGPNGTGWMRSPIGIGQAQKGSQ